jgi:hypothetical protein
MSEIIFVLAVNLVNPWLAQPGFYRVSGHSDMSPAREENPTIAGSDVDQIDKRKCEARHFKRLVGLLNTHYGYLVLCLCCLR